MQAAPTEPSLRATAPSAAAPVGPLESDAAGAMVALSAERLAAIEAKAAQ